MSDPVQLTVSDDVATITISRPEKRNALSQQVSAGILDALNTIEDERKARCLVLTGSEGAFCAGGDISSMGDRMSGETPLHEAVRNIRDVTSQVMKRVHEFYLPTIAAINGVAFGAGANLAIATDIQLMSGDAQLSFGFRQVGLGVDTGTSFFLPRAVGSNIAKELVFTGELVEPDRAKEIGLVNHVYPADKFDERVSEFVEGIASGPTVGLCASKQALIRGFERDISDAMAFEATSQGIVFRSEDHAEGARAFLEKRDPDFSGQ